MSTEPCGTPVGLEMKWVLYIITSGFISEGMMKKNMSADLAIQSLLLGLFLRSVPFRNKFSSMKVFLQV